MAEPAVTFGTQAGIGAVSPEFTRRSAEFMLRDLARSGLLPEDMGCVPRGFPWKQYRDPCYVIPYYDLFGALIPQMYRIRMDNADRYGQPSREELGAAGALVNHPYLGPKTATIWRGGTVRAINEGEKKSAKFQSQLGIPSLGIGGADNWRLKEQRTSVGVLHPVIRTFVQGATTLLIVPDADFRRPNIARSYRLLADHFEEAGVNIAFWQATDKADDYLRDHPEITSWEQMPWVPIQTALMESAEGLQRKYFLSGEVVGRGGAARLRLDANAANAKKLLEGYPGLKGALRYNTDLEVPEYPAMQGDAAAQLRMHFQANFTLTHLSRGEFNTAFTEVAATAPYSPLADWLNSLKWDGIGRFEQLLCGVWKARASAAHMEVVTKLLIGSVARRLEVGESIVDFMATLQGPQGSGKSGSWVVLYGAANSMEINHETMQGANHTRALKTKWALIDNELDFSSKKSSAAMKNTTTTRNDSHRPLYTEQIQDKVRRSIMLGTTDKREYLNTDEAGYRRCGNIATWGSGRYDFDLLKAIREQLWAEAVARYRAGEAYSNLELASEAAKPLVKSDPIKEEVENYLYALASDKKAVIPTIEHDKVMCVWVRTPEFVQIIGRREATSLRISGVLQEIGFTKLDQKKIAGAKVNSVYIMSQEAWNAKFRD